MHLLISLQETGLVKAGRGLESQQRAPPSHVTRSRSLLRGLCAASFSPLLVSECFADLVTQKGGGSGPAHRKDNWSATIEHKEKHSSTAPLIKSDVTLTTQTKITAYGQFNSQSLLIKLLFYKPDITFPQRCCESPSTRHQPICRSWIYWVFMEQTLHFPVFTAYLLSFF